MHVAACKEFYANLTVSMFKEKEVARTRVRGVNIELDSMTLASILGIPGNNGISEYIKDVWEESKYCKPLEITKKFANDDMITTARRIVVPRFGKRNTTSFMDLTYMDHILTRRLVNLPWVMLRHMAYVISVENHELPYGDWLTMVFEAFNVPLIDKQGAEPKRYDFLEETFLTMCQLKRENGVWWEEEEIQQDFDWEAVNEEAEIQEGSGSDDKFYDAEVEVEAPADEVQAVPVFPASPADSTNVQKEPATTGVNPSILTGSMPDSVFLLLQAEFERARADRIQAELDRAQDENARLLTLL
ncbi:hypothetical protein Dimus_021235 [Dionaea muscipula]